jgi:thiamine biosynthesis lipoprotein
MSLRQVREVMGMPVTIFVVGDGPASRPAAEAALEDFALLDRTFSPFLPDSAVNRINRGELAASESGGLVQRAIELCRHYERATGGYFSAWRDGRFEPSGLVKGWAIDRACSILEGHGCTNYFVDAGGDVQARGSSDAGGPWRVGIRHPVSRNEVVRVIIARDLAVATSGIYEKGDHIIDPHSGNPVRDWMSFTVVGPDIFDADVYATAGLAMGEAGLDFIERIPGYEAYAIAPDLVARWTEGFDALCVSPTAAAITDIIIEFAGP